MRNEFIETLVGQAFKSQDKRITKLEEVIEKQKEEIAQLKELTHLLDGAIETLQLQINKLGTNDDDGILEEYKYGEQ